MKKTDVFHRVINGVAHSQWPLLVLILSMVFGAIALNYTPREEEPQIVVPMIDVMVVAPNATARQVERQVTTPLEKLLTQIKGVEHVYSVSQDGYAVVTLRFFVGENREQAILNTYNKLHSNTDKVPPLVKHWQVKPVEVDDVPMMMLALWSLEATQDDDLSLYRLAQEVVTSLQQVPDTSEVNIIGGRQRQIQVLLLPEQMSARSVSVTEIVTAIDSNNKRLQLGDITLANQAIFLQSGQVIANVEQLSNTPVKVVDGAVVLLKEVATVIDQPDDAKQYSWLDFSARHPMFSQASGNFPSVTISIAKQQGSNAVAVADQVQQQIAELKRTLLPSHIQVEVLRDYGQTANEKVNNLTASLAFSVITVVVFIGIFLGWRAAVIVGLAVPVCYGITISLDLLFGYTINRVTLFALILSLGLLVDDPITGVDNISRHTKGVNRDSEAFFSKISDAISEIRTPLLMSTLTIVLAFVPLAFITGMMGPYMAPMAFNVPVSVIASTLVAFFVTPWLAKQFLNSRKATETTELELVAGQQHGFYRWYQQLLMPLLTDRGKAKLALWAVLVLFIAAALLPVWRAVPLKLLPFDNKNEIQVLIEMPANTTLENTAAMAKSISMNIQEIPEVLTVANYIGVASPIDFNGMVRQYYRRQGNQYADLRIVLADKAVRSHQSHAIVLRLRELLAKYNQRGIKIKVVEVPPGPPVLSTIVAEITGSDLTSYQALKDAAQVVEQRLSREPMVVEVDSSVRQAKTSLHFHADKTKAALSGISTADINDVMTIATDGKIAGYVHDEDEASPLAINVKLPQQLKATIEDLQRLTVKGRLGVMQSVTPQGLDILPQPLVAMGELGQFHLREISPPIYHKDLAPIVYVTADVSGRPPAEVIADINADFSTSAKNQVNKPAVTGGENAWQTRSYLTNGGDDYWHLPENIYLSWTGEGELRITVRVFRDMGLAFAFALFAIYLVLRIQTASTALSLIIMSSIPLTIIGIMPGFWLMNQFGERTIAGAPDPVLFTATAMIGMIALAGIVVRNSLILVEFITQARTQGHDIQQSLLMAGIVRMRPVLLTAGTTLLGNLVITLDPVFSGLALAIIFGIISSTVFTLLVVPVVYFLVFSPSNVEQKAL